MTHILIVEDDTDWMEHEKSAAKSHDIETACDADDGLKKLSNFSRGDILVTDGLDGQGLKELVEAASSNGMRVIVYSTHPKNILADKFLANTSAEWEYVSKGIDGEFPRELFGRL